MFSRESVDDARKTSHEHPSVAGNEDPPQSTEGQPVLEKLPEVQESQIYLVEEQKPESAYALFLKALAQGNPGLCITRVYPGILSQKYDFGDSTLLWLSTAGREESVRPRDLERLSLLLEQFLTARKGVVLIDGIEYLITNNDFVTVLRLIQSIRDLVAMNTAIMIISLNPSTLGYQELNLLEREMDCVLRFHVSSSGNQHDFHHR